MNKYIKKTLVIYLSIATILVGMAGISYAITAGEADAYVTRARYTVEMEALQNKLDEAEVTLLGKINKYRSSTIKFVTYDTPNKYDTKAASPYSGGLHTGGNFFPKTRYNNDGYTYIWGTTSSIANAKNGIYRVYYLNRIWNGNFFMTNPVYSSSEGTNPYIYYGCFNFAVPCENLPGWYLVLKSYRNDFYARYFGALVKLDPNVTYDDATTIPSKELVFRLKKDLFVYSATTTPKLTTTPVTTTASLSYYNNVSSNHSGLSRGYYNMATPNTGLSVTSKAWIETTTGDYMFTMRGLRPCCPTYGFQEVVIDAQYIARFIPSDNVEYVQYATVYAESGVTGFPDSRHIGDGQVNDPYWEYEFVDCINGIKYWHAYRKPTKIKLGTDDPLAHGIHYSLPIVY